MIGRVTALICGIASCLFCAFATAQTSGTGVLALTPAEMQWTTQGGLAINSSSRAGSSAAAFANRNAILPQRL